MDFSKRCRVNPGKRFTPARFDPAGIVAIIAVLAAPLVFSFQSNAQSNSAAAPKPIPVGLASGAPKSLQFFPVPTTEKAPEAAISLDGKSLAYCHPVGEGCALTLRNLETGDEKELLKVPRGRCEQIAFAADSDLLFYTLRPGLRSPQTAYRLSLAGGPPAFVAHGVESRIAVSPGAKAIAFLRKDAASGNLQIVEAQTDGSGERVLTQSAGDDTILSAGPAWSPEGTEIAFARQNRWDGPHLFALDVASGHVKEIGGSLWTSVSEIYWLADNTGLALMGEGPPVANGISYRRAHLWYVEYPSGHARQLTNDEASIWSFSAPASGSPLYAILGLPEYSVTIAPLDPDDSISTPLSPHMVLPLPAMCRHQPVTWVSQSELGVLCLASRVGEAPKVVTVSASSAGNPPVLSEQKPLRCAAKNPKFVSYLRTSGSDRSTPSAIGNEVINEGMLAMLPPCLANGRQSAYVLQPAEPPQLPSKLPNGEYSSITPPRKEGARPAALSPDGKLIAAFSEPDVYGATRLLIYDGKGDHALASYGIPSGPGTSLMREAIRWTPDGFSVAYLLHDKSTNVWEQRVDIANPSQPTPPVQVTHLKEGIFSGFDISPDGKQVALDVTLDQSGVVRIVGFR